MSTNSTGGSKTSSNGDTGSNSNGANICHTCNESITTSQFIRVGEYKFHKDHFQCCTCSTSLHGKKFHHKEGKFYCANDYVEKFCHECRHCKQKIATGSVIQAFGGYYHPDHFVCAICSSPFKNGKYYENGDQPYCEEHYFAMTAERCESCNLAVKDNEMVRVQGKCYHNSCLSCDHCQMPLAKKGSIFQKDSKVYCRSDYLNFFCKRCTACGEHILKHCISVNDEFYHPDCLQCSVCNKKLDKYICISGHLRCPDHTEFACSKFSCSVCTKSIEGEIILSVGKKLHPECFNCAFCTAPLNKATAKLKDEKLCCPACLAKKEPSTSTPNSLTTSGRLHSNSASASSSTSNSLTDSQRLRNQSQLTNSGRRSSDTVAAAAAGATSPGGNLSNASPLNSISELHIDDIDEIKTPDTTKASAPPSSSSKEQRAARKMSRMVPQGKIEWKKGELIGKGSFGKVYMAMNSATGELIAVKQVRLNTSEEQEQAIAIQNEIGLMENLRHPNIVSLLGTQRSGNKLNILMEYVPGKSLDSLLEKFGGFSEKVIRSYTKQLLEALAYCHANRVVHRDIKGKNILIDTKGNLKLADFGSAKRFTNVMSKDAPSLSYNYTPLWTAPEVLVGDYNSKVDIWSLGCVIIEMASAHPPWHEQNFENPFRALYHIGNSDSIPKIPDSLSETGRAFVAQCLRRNPDTRPDAQTLLKHEWLQGIEGPVSAESDSDYESDED